MSKQGYVVGFLFIRYSYTTPPDKVVLIRKLKPAWQAGKLNGVGGKIEPGELPIQAMLREFKEETGDRHEHAWERFFETELDDCVLYFYRAFCTSTTAHTVEKEEILLVNVDTVNGCLNNLKWLIPLALSRERLVASEYEPKHP